MTYRAPSSRNRSSNKGLYISKNNKQANNANKANKANKAKQDEFPGLGQEAFPSLGQEANQDIQKLNFADTVVEKKEESLTNNDVVLFNNSKPLQSGWVYMNTKDRTIIDMRETQSNTDYDVDNDVINPEYVIRVIDQMRERWQNERDNLNKLLGDISPYWDIPPFGEEDDDDDYEVPA